MSSSKGKGKNAVTLNKKELNGPGLDKELQANAAIGEKTQTLNLGENKLDELPLSLGTLAPSLNSIRLDYNLFQTVPVAALVGLKYAL